MESNSKSAHFPNIVGALPTRGTNKNVVACASPVNVNPCPAWARVRVGRAVSVNDNVVFVVLYESESLGLGLSFAPAVPVLSFVVVESAGNVERIVSSRYVSVKLSESVAKPLDNTTSRGIGIAPSPLRFAI